jgi:uncharacterized protein (UPF0332 family)
MKKQNLLSKLLKEGRLQLVEPSTNIKESYQRKSESYLASAKILLQNNRLEESVSMTYYSMYYNATSLLYQTGIKCENHTATISLLKELYGLENKDLHAAKKERVDKQYYVDHTTTKTEAETLIKKAEEFNAMILDHTERLNTDKIREHIEKLKNLMNPQKQ